MEKWKVVLIVLLVGALGGYGAYQSISTNPTSTPTGSSPKSQPPASSPQMSLVGKTLPVWRIPSTYWINTAKPLVPADLKGSVAIVEFFRVGCPHCRAEAPLLKNIYEQYRGRGLKMVSIHAPGTAPEENDWSHVQSVVASWGLSYPIAFDAGAVNFKKLYGGLSYPSIYIVDKAGIVRYQQTGEDEKKTAAMMVALQRQMK